MAGYYPIILFPPGLEKFLSEQKNVAISTQFLRKPVSPVIPVEDKYESFFLSLPKYVVIVVVFWAGLFFLYLVDYLFGLTLAQMLLGILSIIIMVIGVGVTIDKGQLYYRNKHIERCKNYRRKNDKYQQELKKWSRDLKIQKRYQKLLKAKYYEERAKVLSNVLQPSGVSNAQKGVSEQKFLLSLQKYFPVNWGGTFPIPDSEFSYSADFALVDPSTGLHIDIEVDEPYDGRTKKPHHCIDRESDFKRNQFFLANNWVVIRFAEVQVVRHPLSCCQVVAQVIAEVTGNYESLELLKDVEPLPQVKQWTTREATLMAKRRFRERYLAETGIYYASLPKNKRRKKYRKNHNKS